MASVVVPLALFGLAAWFDRARLLEDAFGNAERTVALLREHTLKAVETNELLVRQLDQRTRGLTWSEIRDQGAALLAEMYKMHEELPQISALALTDAEGRLWAASIPLSVSAGGYTLISDRELWAAQRAADRGTFISTPYKGSATGRQNFGISRRRSSADGSFDGTVHAAVAVSYFTDFWKQVTVGQSGGSVTLVRTDGEMLARLPELTGSLPRLIASSSPLMQALDRQPQSGSYRSASSVDGVDRVYAYARVGQYPVVVGYGIATASVLTVWRQHVLLLGSASVLAAAALSMLVLLAMRQTRALAEAQARQFAAEAAARQAQRMELLGQLAASVAHDFANVAQAVCSGAAMIERSSDPDRMQSFAGLVRQAGERGGAIARRMLDFSRKNDAAEPEAEATDIAGTVADLCNLLSGTSGPLHSLDCNIQREGLPATVRGSRRDVEAALMNLAANARDAMPTGGKITVGVAPDIVEVGGRIPGLAPGLYARISITDTGEGMPPHVLERASEAFFTTKPRGKGTGLGLSGARGFAEQAGGRLQIESELGQGTTVTLWLPDNATALAVDLGGNVTPLRLRKVGDDPNG